MLLNHMRFRHPRCSSAAASSGRPFCHSAPACFRSAQTCRATSRSSEGSSQQDDGRWWDGPAPGGGSSVPEGPVPKMPEELSHAETEVLRQGPEEAARWENIRKNERQRTWDVMRLVAKDRYEKGEMPSWFNPQWLSQQEAPLNEAYRIQGEPIYQNPRDLTAQQQLQKILDLQLDMSGGDNGEGGGGRDDRDRFYGDDGEEDEESGLWREGDPYWMLRDIGMHPMRFWTFVYAALLAAGGVYTFIRSGCSESLQVGMGAAALLSICAVAMSDMVDGPDGHLAVKAAWAICLSLSVKELFLGWRHKIGTREYQSKQLGVCGWSAFAMCLAYMWTGMSGLSDDLHLPMNPGGAFKLPNIAIKSRVWERWGYGGLSMKQ